VKIEIVKKGDTLWKIAQKYGVDVEELIKANPQISNPDMIMPGMQVKIPTTAVQAKKEAPKKQVPKMETKKEAPKKEAPKAMPKDLPKAEMPKAEMPKKDLSKVGGLLEEIKPLIKELLNEMKPEIVNEIKLELEMTNVEQVKPFHPAPPPAPKAHMPVPYMPEHKPKMAPMDHSCHPCTPYSPYHYQQSSQPHPMGYGVSPMNQMPMSSGPMTPNPMVAGGMYGNHGNYGYGMPMDHCYPSYPANPYNKMMSGGREADPNQNNK
jgi:morphogenetic protein associated with SpoVID